VKRRDFITLFGGAAAAWPLAVRAQQGERTRVVGVLEGYSAEDREAQARHAAFSQGLKRLGWAETRNIRIERRYARGSLQEAQALARELVSLQPDVMFATSTVLAGALQRESRAIPIVFVGVSDPIGSGFIASLARPGGNMTGLLNFEASITGKWLAMLKEIAPQLTRAAFMANPKTTPYDYFLRGAEAAAPTLGLELVPSRVADAADIERDIASFAQVPGGGLVLPPDVTTTWHRDLVIVLAVRHRLPAVYSFRYHVAAGGLMSYGPALVDLFRQSASYVDRILRGANPAELPVQTPIKYETALNLKTAKALGLEVPPTLLARADEVIE
jgi:putative tryptophan/tyrosine transport system substrate-binding protein